MKVLVCVDCQIDFTTGALANPIAEEKIPVIKERVAAARENHEMVIFKTYSGTMFRFSYCGKYDNLNEVDYESDKAMLKDLAEDRIKED